MDFHNYFKVTTPKCTISERVNIKLMLQISKNLKLLKKSTPNNLVMKRNRLLSDYL